MAHSIMESSGSKVVQRWMAMPGRRTARHDTYRGAIPQQEYTAVCHDGKWHLQRTRKKPIRNPVPDNVRS